MKSTLLFDFTVSKENKTIHIKREFDANPGLVWEAWTTAEILDQWWAPKPWRAETKRMDFREGGFWHYAMVGPEGEKHWGKTSYITIKKEKSYTAKDGFCDENGTINPEFPQNLWQNNFIPKENKTEVDVLLTFDKLSDLEKTIEMGFKEGFTMALENLDQYIEAKSKLRKQNKQITMKNTKTMEESETNKRPEFLDEVIRLNGDITLSDALKQSLDKINELDIARLNQIGLKTYKEDKWSVHKIIQHLIDWERIWCFRAVIFARGEGTAPDGHDQEIMGKNSNADELPIEQLIDELSIVRQSTIMMFKSFNKEILETNCEFFEYEMPLYMIGYSITAHQIHHFNIIKERYVPLIK